MRILIVEDDPALGPALTQALTQRGFAVDRVERAGQASAALSTGEFDAIVLDLGLPDGSGLDVLKAARARGVRTPVLVLTARDAVEDRVAGLNSGADDYLVKPFDLSELDARIHALIRRSQGNADTLVAWGAAELDPIQRELRVEGRRVDLSPREYGVAEALITRGGRVVSKERIVETVCNWDKEFEPSTVEVYVHRLRKKLADTGLNIRTLRGFGYMLERPDAEPAV